MKKSLKILHSPENVGGNPWGLATAERTLGYQSTVAVYHDHPFGYPADITLGVRRLTPLGFWKTLKFLSFALKEYDIFHFNFGHSLIDAWPLLYADLPLIKRAGKPIIITFQGCEGRGTHPCFQYHPEPESAECPICSNPRLVTIRQKKLALARRYADKIYVLNPDLLAEIPEAEFLPYASVFPKDYTFQQRPQTKAGQPLRIVHAPSHRSVKGTKYVIRAVDVLRKQGLAIELILIENKSHADTLKILQTADLAIDQLIIGWYGAFAVESMTFGIPTIAYIAEDDLARITLEQHPPIISARPDNLASVLAPLVTDRNKLAAISRQSRSYAETVHDPHRIAQQVGEEYERLIQSGTRT